MIKLAKTVDPTWTPPQLFAYTLDDDLNPNDIEDLSYLDFTASLQRMRTAMPIFVAALPPGALELYYFELAYGYLLHAIHATVLVGDHMSGRQILGQIPSSDPVITAMRESLQRLLRWRREVLTLCGITGEVLEEYDGYLEEHGVHLEPSDRRAATELPRSRYIDIDRPENP